MNPENWTSLLNSILWHAALLFCLSAPLSAQSNQFEVSIGKKSVFIPAYQREGMVYFSIKDFADVLSINYFYNEETGKIELKFDDYSLKFTGKNPFIILKDKNENTEIFQLPTSVYLIDNDLYVPAAYSVSLLQKAYGGKIQFEASDSGCRLLVEERKGKENLIPSVSGIPDIKPNDAGYSSGLGITGISFEEKANGTLVKISSGKKIKSYKSSYMNGVLTIIFRDVTADLDKIKNASAAGLVKDINVRNINGDTEFRFKVEKDYSTNEVINAGSGNDLLITIYSSAFSNKQLPGKFNEKSKWNFNVVVIDPGHGGKDYGAIAVNGVKEKDVNLGIALKLGKLIEKSLKDLKVVYTRDDDSFVELYRRGKIANEKDGKLFISIHCNSTPKKNTDANGFEIYLLRPGRTQEAIAIAERENSVIEYEENPERYQKLTDENFILVSMAHSSFMRYSEKFSGILNEMLTNDVSLSSRGIKQAGFYVLVGASMPGVLIESGFLSNKDDADFLKGSKGQEEIAESIFNAVKKYKEEYEILLQSRM